MFCPICITHSARTPRSPSHIHCPLHPFPLQKRRGLQQTTGKQDKMRFNQTRQKPSIPRLDRQEIRSKRVSRTGKRVRGTAVPTFRCPSKHKANSQIIQTGLDAGSYRSRACYLVFVSPYEASQLIQLDIFWCSQSPLKTIVLPPPILQGSLISEMQTSNLNSHLHTVLLWFSASTHLKLCLKYNSHVKMNRHLCTISYISSRTR